MAAANEVQIVIKGDNKAKPAVADAKKDVKELAKTVDAVPDKKVIDIKATDNASKTVKEVDAQKVADKNVKIRGDDQASAEIDKVSKTKPKEVEVPIKAGKPSGFEDVGKDLGDKFKGYGEKAGGVFGVGLVAGLASGDFAGSVADIFGDALEKAKETKQVKIDLQNSMGINDAMAKDFGNRVGDAYAKGLGDSQGQIVQAYGSMSSAVKNWASLSTSEQDKVTKSAVKIAQAFHIDVNDAIRAAGAMMDSGLVTSWNSAFDIITTGLQTLGPRGDDFLETLGEYSGYFKQIGFDGQQALGLISQGLKAGARDTDYVADAWKELGIRIIDQSKETQGALLDLGLATEKHVKEKVGKTVKDVTQIMSDIPGQIAAGGEGAQQALGKVISKLQGIKDPVEQNRIGVALFGTQWEDTMRRVVNATDLAGAKTTAFMGATDRLVTQSESQSEQFSRRWEKGLSRFGEGLAGFANNVGTGFDNAAGFVDKMVTRMIDLDGHLDTSKEKVGNFWEALAGLKDKAITVTANTADERKIKSVFDQLKGLPVNTPVKVEGITSEAEQRLRDLGYTVTHLPGGYVNVSANTGEAYKNVEDLVWWINRRQANIPVKITTSTTGPLKNIKGGMAANAAGGPVHGAASGGARTSLTRVNERGPELGRGQDGTIRDLETGSTVIPAGQSAAIMSGQGPVGLGAGGGGGWGAPNIYVDMTGLSGIARAIAESIRYEVRTSGKNGSVQRWAGQ